MQVLVEGDPAHDGLACGILDVLAGVEVRDACGQLLERHVSEALKRVGRLGSQAALHLGHARPLEAHGIDGAGDGQVVVDHLAVATLLSRPAPNPMAPSAVAAEHALDVPEVVGQVVLGQDIDEQRAAGLGAEPGLFGRPLVVGWEVLAPTPGHQRVGMPLFGLSKVALVEPLDAWLELG